MIAAKAKLAQAEREGLTQFAAEAFTAATEAYAQAESA